MILKAAAAKNLKTFAWRRRLFLVHVMLMVLRRAAVGRQQLLSRITAFALEKLAHRELTTQSWAFPFYREYPGVFD
jgi:hypothetical protein